jgi:DUF1009 family protein
MADSPTPNRLGIIAGSGSLPWRLAEACGALGREFFVLALEGAADPHMVAGLPHAWCRLGAAAKGLGLLRANNVTELVLAGGVRRPSLAALRPDWRAARLFARIGYRALGDDGLLSAVVAELEEEGFRVTGADELLTSGILGEGPLGRWRPDAQALADIEHGARVAALKREGPGGVLVKLEKPGQERRADRPTIGPATVAIAAASGLRGIAVEALTTIVLDREEVRAAADGAGLFVYGLGRV